MNRIAMVLLAAAGAAMGQDGHKIMMEVQKRAHADSMRYEGSLQTCPKPSCADKKGQLNVKELLLRRWVYERIGDAGKSKSIIRFLDPPDVKGIALLTVNHPDAASDQWLWRPPNGKEQKMSLGDRDNKFFNTDFTFEDLEERDADQYDYTVTGEAKGEWRIDAKPRKMSQYTHCYFYIDKTKYTFSHTDCYDKRGLIRLADYGNYESINNIWTAKGIAISDPLHKTRTGMTIDKVEYNIPLKDSDFTPEGLHVVP
jgi:hypothetical protein